MSDNSSVLVNYCNNAQQEHEWIQAKSRDAGRGCMNLFCHYQEPSIIFGVSQRPELAHQSFLDDHNVPWLRRRAGGGAVFAGNWLLGVTTVLPSTHALACLDQTETYQHFSGVWLNVLDELGIECRLPSEREMSISRASAKEFGTDWACYAAIGHGELVSDDGRKLLGLTGFSAECTKP